MTALTRWQTPARPTSPDWWFRDAAGRIVLAQAPNRPAIAWTTAATVARLPFVPRPVRAAGLVIGDATRSYWAYQEARSGVTPARALVGAATLAVDLAGLARLRRRIAAL